jgi:RHS repeat-associated protein
VPAFKVCGDETVQRFDQPGSTGEEVTVAESIVDTAATSSEEVAPNRIIGQSNPYSPPARFVFYHADHLGSPRVILNDTGQVVALHHYLPFGDERPAGTDPTLNTKAFTGHERDTETGLDYMMARYYSSSLGRFMAVDPGDDTHPEDPQSWNKYSYVRNNPIGMRDPDGRIAGVDDAAEVMAVYTAGAAVVGAVVGFWNAPSSGDPKQTNGQALMSTAAAALQAMGNSTNLLGNNSSDAGAKGETPPGGHSEAQEPEKGSEKTGGKPNSPDQDAVIQMAKEGKATGGITASEAENLKGFAKEAGVKTEGPHSHSKRPAPTSKAKHMHVGPVNHIPVKPDTPKP